MSAVPVTLRRVVELEIDGQTVRAMEGQTILQAVRALDVEIPTLCWGETLTPVNACRVCMVEVEGSRVLVPSCARKVEPGMVVRTNGDRVRHSRKMVLEFLASSVDLSTTPNAARWIEEYGAEPDRYGRTKGGSDLVALTPEQTATKGRRHCPGVSRRRPLMPLSERC